MNCVSKKQLPILYSKLPYKIGNYFAVASPFPNFSLNLLFSFFPSANPPLQIVFCIILLLVNTRVIHFGHLDIDSIEFGGDGDDHANGSLPDPDVGVHQVGQDIPQHLKQRHLHMKLIGCVLRSAVSEKNGEPSTYLAGLKNVGVHQVGKDIPQHLKQQHLHMRTIGCVLRSAVS